MCTMVFLEESEINTPQELIDIAKIPIDKIKMLDGYKLHLDNCLCGVDLRKIFEESNYNYTIDDSFFDYTITKKK